MLLYDIHSFLIFHLTPSVEKRLYALIIEVHFILFQCAIRPFSDFLHIFLLDKYAVKY